MRSSISLLTNLGVGVSLTLATLAHADPPQGLPFPFVVPFSTPKAPVRPPLRVRPPWVPAPRRSAPTFGFPWATTRSRPSPTMPFFPAPGLPFSGSRYAPGGAPPSPFAPNPFNNPFTGGSAMGMLTAPMLQGATSIVAPMAINYAIASMNPTTFNNFLGLMMTPQSMGSNFGMPFWGFGGYQATRPLGFGYPQPVAPSNPFLSLFAPRPRR